MTPNQEFWVEVLAFLFLLSVAIVCSATPLAGTFISLDDPQVLGGVIYPVLSYRFLNADIGIIAGDLENVIPLIGLSIDLRTFASEHNILFHFSDDIRIGSYVNWTEKEQWIYGIYIGRKFAIKQGE